MALVQLTALFAILGILYCLRSWLRSGYSLPPGPKRLPLVGNLMDLPARDIPGHEHWIKYKHMYGPLSSVNFFGTVFVIIHCPDMAHELLSTMSNKTSGRPDFFFGNKLCGYGNFMVNHPSNSKHRLRRKMMSQYMGTKKAIERFHDIEELQSRQLLLCILDNPSELRTHIQTNVAAVIMKLTYGYTTQRSGIDPAVALLNRVLDDVGLALTPLTWPVDYLPLLRYIPTGVPGIKFKKLAQQMTNRKEEALDGPFEFAREQMNRQANDVSYVASLLKTYDQNDGEKSDTKVDEVILKHAAGEMYMAGFETTSTTIINFISAMLLFPSVQRVAQKEIDDVIGTERLPNFEDRKRLPYINALVKETHRWLPALPMGAAHCAEQELIFAEHSIPKGAYLLPAVWSFLHDPNTYLDPDTFNPGRFLKEHMEPDPTSHAFGYGRRICPGQHLADDILFITISRLLAAFTITKALDDEGREIDVALDIAPGLFGCSRPHPYRISSRSAQHKELIRSSISATKEGNGPEVLET